MNIEKGRIINDFIEPNKKQYAIPVYQRNYEWTKSQCKKLFDDIILAYKKERTHFCGSIVYARLKEENKLIYYVVIDGQQRLTTIYILLKALIDLAEDDKTREAITDTVMNKDKFDKFGIDQASKLKLKPIKSDDKQLRFLMEDKTKDTEPEIDLDSSIWINYNYFKELTQEFLKEGYYVKDVYEGIQQLICAKILLDDDDNAQEMFERINSTGLPLSLSDKIRNFVLMTDANQEELYEKYWLKIEEHLKRGNMNTFFLDYLNVKMEGFTKEDEAYENFKKIYWNGKYDNEGILKEIVHYADHYHAFLFGNPKYGETVNSVLKDLQYLKQTTVFLFLFYVFDDYENGIIDLKTLEKTMLFIRNYSIRRLICEVGSNSLRGLYKSLHGRIFEIEDNKKHYYDAIVSFFKQLTSKDALISDDGFEQALKYNNLYRKNSLCKFLLVGIENKGKEQIVADNLTIEHVMPQNKNLSSAWQKMLGQDWRNVQEKYLHTLGNLTLTGHNSELGDKPFTEKKKEIEKLTTKAVILYSDIKDKTEWNKENIEKRAERLSSEVLKIFGIEPPEQLISFADPRYQEYTCEEPNDATNKTPNYYVLQGERVNVNNYTVMLKSVIDRLYEIDKSIIEKMAMNDEKPVKWSKRILFSYDKNNINGDYRIGDTAIYEDTGFSSYQIMCIIKALLEKYEIDTEEFVYSAKDNKQSKDN